MAKAIFQRFREIADKIIAKIALLLSKNNYSASSTGSHVENNVQKENDQLDLAQEGDNTTYKETPQSNKTDASMKVAKEISITAQRTVDFKSAKSKNVQSRSNKKIKRKNKPKAETSSEEKFERRKGKIVYPLSRHTFLTRSNLIYCTSHNHQLIDIYGRVSVVMDDKIRDFRFPAVYCQTCDKFFVLEHIYKWLQSKGRILCRVVTKDYWIPKKSHISTDYSSDIYGDPESQLHYLGYNVNSQSNLSKAQRRHILRRIIVSKEMTQAEIESHLAYLIRRNQYNYNFQKAIEKWYEDLLFIESIDLNYSRIPMEELKINRYQRY